MKRNIILIIFIITSTYFVQAQRGDSFLNKLQLSGYYENAFMVQEKEDVFLVDYNKLRVDLNAKLSEQFSFNADVILKTYHGTTTINVLDYIPEQVVNNYFDSIGLPREEVESLFYYSYLNEIFLDNVFISYYSNNLNVRIGKQQLPWGSGYVWNPTNVFHVKDPLDPTYEMTGVNAFKAEIPFRQEGMITGIFSVNEYFKNSTYALKLQDHFIGFDFSVSYVWYEYMYNNYYTFSEDFETRQLIGFDFSGSLLGIGLWGEMAYKFSTSKGGSRNYGNYVLGFDYTFQNGLYVMSEFYHNEKGKANYLDYNMNDWMAYMGPYAENLGRYYVYVGESMSIGNHITWSNFLLLNINDRSGMVYPWFDFSLGDNTVLNAVAYIPFGRKETEFGEYGFGGMIRIRVYF